MNEELEKESLADWKTYLRWHLVHADAPYLSAPFLNENFAFYGKTLRGQQELQAALEALHANTSTTTSAKLWARPTWKNISVPKPSRRR